MISRRRSRALLPWGVALVLAAGCAGDGNRVAPTPDAEPLPAADEGLPLAELASIAAEPPPPVEPPRSPAYEDRPPLSLTWARDIAPIIYANCTPCHRQGEAAPFTLTSYRDVKKRMRQIATVTRSGFMPPWLPAHGYGDFEGTRQLTGDQIGMIQQWVREGAQEGNPAAAPAPPTFTRGWRLGEPDLLVTLPAPYRLQSDGFDVFRNFVIPDVVPATRYVRGLEFRANNPRVIHHAEFMIDETDLSERQDEREPGPGYSGMHADGAHSPAGHFLGWVPGKTPFLDRGGMSWALEPGTDLVIQLHMLPSGKPEEVRPTLGLFFSDDPPRHEPLMVRIGSRSMDISPGEASYEIRDVLRLPVTARVLSVFPHAHYLGKEIEGWATLPDGTKRWLIRIPDWDFNWQDSFRLAEPLELPAGSFLGTRFVFDNSEANVRNPHHPPQRVVYGPSTFDEMCDLWIQLLPADPRDREILKASFTAKENLDWIGVARRRVEADPDEPHNHLDLGTRLLDAGEVEEAMAQLREVIRLDPDEPLAYHNLAVAFMRQGRPDQGEHYFARALEADPGHLDSLLSLTRVYLQTRRFQEAAATARRAVEVSPDDPSARFTLGRALQAYRDERGALLAYDDVLRLQPDSVLALDASARMLATSADPAVRDPRKALERASRAVELTGRQQPMALSTLAAAHAAAGEFDRAIAATEEALALLSGPQGEAMAQGLRQQLDSYRQGGVPGAS